MTAYDPELLSVAYIPLTGRFGCFVDLGGRSGFVEAEGLPTHTLIALATATNLINVHALVPGGIDPDSMHLDNTREAIIAELKALAVAQSITGYVGPHVTAPYAA